MPKPRKLTQQEKNIVVRFEREVCERAVEVDPCGVREWESIAIGFFLAVGLDMEQAERCVMAGRERQLWK